MSTADGAQQHPHDDVMAVLRRAVARLERLLRPRLVDGVMVASSSSSPLETSWDARATPPGSHAITAAATDQLGQRAVAAKVSVVVAAAEQVPPGGGRAGGGCSSAPGTLDGALAALLLALGSRRRRAA
jgi:uncharacterized protein (TIGR03382 family)